jgi:hypothetical protein
MAQLAIIIIVLALAGAVASWIAGAMAYVRTLRSISGTEASRRQWLAVVVWPFARGRLKGATADHTGPVNKALVAFIACVMVAVAATSAATNLSRLSR